ncbi:hypothetical protein SEVIR_6G190600v4 [Setaria viridis]
MVNESVQKDRDVDGSPPTSRVPEIKLRHNFRLGDVTWVKLDGSSWWPAQMLKQENKSAMETFREVIEKELSCDNSPSVYDEEAVNSKGGSTKGTSKKNSSRKVRKQGLKPQYSEEEDQDVGSTETTGVTARKRKGGRLRQSSSTYDAIDKASSESSAEGLRNKRQKHGVQSASVDRREGLRRSARSDAKQYLDAAEDSSEPLTDRHAGEDATEASMLDGTSAPHTEIKAMVRDILFKDIIDREHDAEMAYVDEVINGICGATEDIMSGGATASTKGGRGVKQSGSGVEGESSNVRQRRRDEATEDSLQATSPETKKGNTDTTHVSQTLLPTLHNSQLLLRSQILHANLTRFHQSREAVVKTPGQLSARQIRIMQSLGLIAPSGSPFGRDRAVATTNQQF